MAKRHTMLKRHKTTVWLNRDLWQQFMEKAGSHHLSTCLVLEALMSAYLYGGSTVPGQTGPQVVNITVEREEMRPRRREDEKYVRIGKKPRENHYDPYQGWTYDPDLRPGLTIVEQPRQWKGDDKGFKWNEEAQLWWRLE